VSICCVFRTVC